MIVQLQVDVTHGKIAYDTSALKTLMRGLKDGKYVLTLKPFRANRSNQANRRYWALLTCAARELGNDDPEELHEGLALKFLKLPPDEKTGLERRLSTAKLNTEDFNVYMDAVTRYFVVDLHLDMTDFLSEWAA